MKPLTGKEAFLFGNALRGANESSRQTKQTGHFPKTRKKKNYEIWKKNTQAWVFNEKRKAEILNREERRMLREY